MDETARYLNLFKMQLLTPAMYVKFLTLDRNTKHSRVVFSRRVKRNKHGFITHAQLLLCSLNFLPIPASNLFPAMNAKKVCSAVFVKAACAEQTHSKSIYL